MFNFLSGYKTYLIAITSLAYAGVGLWSGSLDWNEAIQIMQTALLGSTIRHGISKVNDE